jgi:prepilin-type N-terminal cleavage/methylation domain-containing protein
LRQRLAKREEGFTLIELLIVILILGILAAIVVVALTGTSQDARTKACSDDARNTYNALNNYVLRNGDLVPASTGVNGTDFNGSIPTPPGAQKSFNPTTMKVALFNTNPGAGGQYGELTQLVPAYISKIPNDVAVYYVQSQDPNNTGQFQYTYAVGPNPNTGQGTYAPVYAPFLPKTSLSVKSIQECTVAGL